MEHQILVARKIVRKTCLLMIFPIITSCQNAGEVDYPYKTAETQQFLNDITKNATASITDLTERNKQASDEFEIVTYYPLSTDKLKAFKANGATLENKDNDISDFASYTFKTYELINEKNEKLQFVDNGRAIYLQEYGLWEYDEVMCQNLGISIKLDRKFKALRGSIVIEFEMPNKLKKEVKIPVSISVDDKLPMQ